MVDGDTIDVEGPIKVTAERDPAQLPYGANGVDIVLECRAVHETRGRRQAYRRRSQKVIISALAGADLTVVYGVNHQQLTADHAVISNARTTNCLAPVAHVLNQAIGIGGYMTTIHAFTGDQPTLDVMHKDLYRGRSAGSSIIPTSTGAAKAVGLVLPELAGKLDGTAIGADAQCQPHRLQVHPQAATTVDAVNAAVAAAAGEAAEASSASTIGLGVDRLQP